MNDTIQHHGVKGMHWGVRKEKYTSGVRGGDSSPNRIANNSVKKSKNAAHIRRSLKKEIASNMKLGSASRHYRRAGRLGISAVIHSVSGKQVYNLGYTIAQGHSTSAAALGSAFMALGAYTRIIGAGEAVVAAGHAGAGVINEAKGRR